MRILLVTLTFHCDADPDTYLASKLRLKTLKKYKLDADPDPAYHFDADPDPACHFDADATPDPTFSFMQIRIPNTELRYCPKKLKILPPLPLTRKINQCKTCNQCCGSGIFIPGPRIRFFPARILALDLFTYRYLPNPDSGSRGKKAPDPGSANLLAMLQIKVKKFQIFQHVLNLGNDPRIRIRIGIKTMPQYGDVFIRKLTGQKLQLKYRREQKIERWNSKLQLL
jgi:hypothetical protein